MTGDMTPSPAAPVPPVATPAQRERIDKVAREFETAFLQVMMTQMFDTVSTGEFSGGEGEAAFKSFLSDAYSKQVVARGGVGLADQLTHELLRMQGLNAAPAEGAAS